MTRSSLYQAYQRYRSLRSGRISALPIVILMPHSSCNCRCVMCDIWKDNRNTRQLTIDDVEALLQSLRGLGTQQVLMSGGEALLNPNFFRLCEILRKEGIRVSLHSTGLTLEHHAEKIVKYVSDLIVSLDGDERKHDEIRNIPGAFRKMREGIKVLRKINPRYRISSRTVIHRLNFRHWPAIIASAKELGIDQVSFLPADVSSHAFNREVLWSEKRQHEILIGEEELEELRDVTESIIAWGRLNGNYIAEDEHKLRKIPTYYSAFYGHHPFPYKRCNAPWVSAVVEADGTVRPCFFHAPLGNIHSSPLQEIINSEESIRFRKELDMDSNETCKRCVCYLHLSPTTKLN